MPPKSKNYTIAGVAELPAVDPQRPTPAKPFDWSPNAPYDARVSILFKFNSIFRSLVHLITSYSY